MRPIFFGASIDPPAMDVVFPPQTSADWYRIVRGVRIRTPVATVEEAMAAAMFEVQALTPLQAELLREISVPVSREELIRDDVPAFAVNVIDRPALFTGPVFCPACCRKLGAGDSPALGYISTCPGCKRPLSIESDERGVRITLGQRA